MRLRRPHCVRPRNDICSHSEAQAEESHYFEIFRFAQDDKSYLLTYLLFTI